MKKFNLSEIMKNAWAMAKEHGVTYNGENREEIEEIILQGMRDGMAELQETLMQKLRQASNGSDDHKLALYLIPRGAGFDYWVDHEEMHPNCWIEETLAEISPKRKKELFRDLGDKILK